MRRSPRPSLTPTLITRWRLGARASPSMARWMRSCPEGHDHGLMLEMVGPSFPSGASTEALTEALDGLSPPDNMYIRYDAVLRSWGSFCSRRRACGRLPSDLGGSLVVF
eukprot:349892-Chlamydomonas_euryale.AAC.3